MSGIRKQNSINLYKYHVRDERTECSAIYSYKRKEFMIVNVMLEWKWRRMFMLNPKIVVFRQIYKSN